MKYLSAIILLLLSTCVQAQHTSAWKEVKAGSTGASAAAGDTLNFAPGNYTYFVLNGVNATKAKPVVLLFNAVATFKNGFDVTNSKGLKFDGGNAYNLKVRGATGVAFSFKGKCGDIQLIGADVDGAYSWGWFKTEVGEPAFANWDYWTKNADGTISANYIMDGLLVKHCIFKNAAFDGWYVNSTGQQADRAMVIDGKTFFPLPPKCANIQFEDVVMDGAARTGMQISGLLSGNNYIKNVTIKNCGKSLENYQGACFLIGGNSPADIEIDGNTFDGSNLYAVRTDGGGTIKFTNNTVAHSNTVNGQIRPTKMAAVQFDGVKPQTKLIITGNTVDPSNNGVSIVVYGDKNTVSAESVIANNKLAGSFQNFSGVQFKTADTTPVPPVDPNPPVDPVPVTITDVKLNADNTLTVSKSDGTKETIPDVQELITTVQDGKIIWQYKKEVKE